MTTKNMGAPNRPTWEQIHVSKRFKHVTTFGNTSKKAATAWKLYNTNQIWNHNSDNWTTSKRVSTITVSYSRNQFARGFPAAGGRGSICGTHRSQGFNSPAALTGTRQEVQEKTVYIYLTHQHFGEVSAWTSEAGMTDPLSSTSPTVNMCWLQSISLRQLQKSEI